MPAIDTPSPAGQPRKRRDSTRLALGIADRRSLAWRRRCQIVKTLTEALGNGPLEPMLAGKVNEAAELATVAELTRASFLQGAGATADDVVRTARAASLAERRLGIAERAKDTGGALTLRDRLVRDKAAGAAA